VTYWPRFFDRNQAITVLTVTELPERKTRQQTTRWVAALREETTLGRRPTALVSTIEA